MRVWLQFLALALVIAGLEIPAQPGKKGSTVSPSVKTTTKSSSKTEDIIGRLQAKWDKTESFQASFRQTVTSKQLGTRDESRGAVSVLKPERLRWESETDGSTQILNGGKFIVIQKNPRRGTREVDIYHNVSKAIDTKLLKFLAGKAKFKSIYRFQLLKDRPDVATLSFSPLKGTGDVIVAEIDKKSYLLRSVTSNSDDSEVRLELINIKTNVTLDPSLFEYKPSSSDIVRES